jgi:hypothetical protein
MFPTTGITSAGCFFARAFETHLIFSRLLHLLPTGPAVLQKYQREKKYVRVISMRRDALIELRGVNGDNWRIAECGKD